MSGIAKRPSVRFLFAHPAHFIALGFGSGLSPVGPGTAGTLVAFPLAALLRMAGGDATYLGVVAALFALGVWCADRTGRAMGVSDSAAIVIDEIVAFMLVLFFVTPLWTQQAVAFGLFRLFDIYKLPPASMIDRQWHHGFGVMADDIVAAFYALLAFALVKRLLS